MAAPWRGDSRAAAPERRAAARGHSVAPVRLDRRRSRGLCGPGGHNRPSRSGSFPRVAHQLCREHGLPAPRFIPRLREWQPRSFLSDCRCERIHSLAWSGRHRMYRIPKSSTSSECLRRFTLPRRGVGQAAPDAIRVASVTRPSGEGRNEPSRLPTARYAPQRPVRPGNPDVRGERADRRSVRWSSEPGRIPRPSSRFR